MRLGVFAAAVLAAWTGALAPGLRAQPDPYTAPYCEVPAGTKLLYSDRAYLIKPKPVDAPPLYFSYRILAPTGQSKHVKRRSQFLFDDGIDQWDVTMGLSGLQNFWPLQPDSQLSLERLNRRTHATDQVSFVVLGLEPIGEGRNEYTSWEIRRIDQYSDGTSFYQFLWYAPEICALSAFTDSQHRVVNLLRVLKPGDHDYNRPLKVEKHRLYFADNGSLVK